LMLCKKLRNPAPRTITRAFLRFRPLSSFED
jgi:hypothetical protein